jgi:predicted MFS family arabinose efflux permease
MTDGRATVSVAQVDEPAPLRGALYWLALGTFAIGTEGFMIAAILPDIAVDLAISVPLAGSLMSVFALAYALSSPVLTALTGRIARPKLLLGAMTIFSLANVVAASTHTYSGLAAARVLLACAAGLYTPNANALAGALVSPERRGRAIAIVNGGLSLAIAVGVPLGAVVGNRLGWRMTFVGVAVMSAAAAVGLLVGLPARAGAGTATATLRERVRVVRQPRVAPTLLVTTIWAVGTYAVYSFIAPFLLAATPLRGSQVGYALFLWGAAAFVGLIVGGNATDKVGVRVVIRTSLVLLTLALAGLSTVAHVLPPAIALAPVLLAMVAWASSAWAFFPAQQTGLIQIVGVELAPIVLSLNASFMYLGFSFGAAIGSFTLLHATVTKLGWVGAVCELAAVTLFLKIRAATRVQGTLAGEKALPCIIN